MSLMPLVGAFWKKDTSLFSAMSLTVPSMRELENVDTNL